MEALLGLLLLALAWLGIYAVLWAMRALPQLAPWRWRRQRLATILLKAAAAAMKTMADAAPRASRKDARHAAVRHLVSYSQVIGIRLLTHKQARVMIRSARQYDLFIDSLKLPGRDADAADIRNLSFDICNLAVKVAIEDDRITAKELDALGEVAAGLQLTRFHEDTLLAILGVVARQAVLDADFDAKAAEEMFDVAHELAMDEISEDLKHEVMAYAFEMAIADGLVTRAEKIALTTVIMCLGYQSEDLDLLLSSYIFARMDVDSDDEAISTEPDGETSAEPDYEATTPWGILEVSRSCTEDELKAAYRTKMRQWHPDLMSSDRHEEATRMAAEINRSYQWMRENLLRARAG